MDADQAQPQRRASDAGADADADADAGERLEPARLIAATALAVVGLVGIAALVGAYFREPLRQLSHAFVEHLGGPGIAVGYAVPDAFTVPIPNDTFGWFGIEGGVPFWIVVMWGTIGSIAGGSVGYLIGGRLRRVGWIARWVARRGRRLEALVRRYGVLVVAVAAVTPLPYSLSAWAAGAVRMPFSWFLATSLLRVFRVAGGLYLIVLGLLSTS